MFSVPRANLIENDEGFSVEVLGAFDLRYREGDRAVNVACEPLVGAKPFIIYSSSIQTWSATPGNVEIDDHHRELIVQRIRDAFRFRGYELEVAW
jgi:hypothetical protein